MALFTYLKIILLQYFQFSVISSIQTDPMFTFVFFFKSFFGWGGFLLGFFAFLFYFFGYINSWGGKICTFEVFIH